MTPAGIEPANFRFVAQHLNHCATAVPLKFTVFPQFSVILLWPFRNSMWPLDNHMAHVDNHWHSLYTEWATTTPSVT